MCRSVLIYHASIKVGVSFLAVHVHHFFCKWLFGEHVAIVATTATCVIGIKDRVTFPYIAICYHR